MTDSLKKKYVPPAIIDLSLEGITGIGAGSCNSGQKIGTANCISNGEGASSTCAFMGIGVSSACTSGWVPYETGTLCRTNGLAAAACNSMGSSANEGLSRCITGGSAAHSSTDPVHCSPGAADSHVCWAGDANIPYPPSS